LVVAFGSLVNISAARAQGWYYINRQPASLSVAQVMAARGLPYGYYWLQPNGNWGFEGNADVVGNISGRRPSLSERGLLYWSSHNPNCQPIHAARGGDGACSAL